MKKDCKAEKKEATILFCDIRHFTKLFESVDPLKAVRFANSVLGELGSVVEQGGGTVDRFTGDGFLAHFGIVEKDYRHVESACNVALKMRKELKKINNKRYFDVETVVAAGTGIHTGQVAYGEIKTEQINQKTVLGDVVNTASRIEKLTKYFSVDILLSQSSYRYVEDDFDFQTMPAKNLSGKKEQVQTYWLLPMN